MQYGYVKVAAVTPKVKVCDTVHNENELFAGIKNAYAAGADIIVTPELSITGYTCGELFLQHSLLNAANEALVSLAKRTAGMEALIFVGFPFSYMGKLYNTAAVINKGNILALIPKTFIPGYGEFYENRFFSPAPKNVTIIDLPGEKSILFGRNIIFTENNNPLLKVAAEICEDLWTANPPSSFHASAGATVVVNLSASNENTGKDIYRKDLVKNQSARLLCGYVYCSAGEGESTQDVVFSGHNIICENGVLLNESKRFENSITVSEIDLERIDFERRRMSTFSSEESADYTYINFSIKNRELSLTRYIDSSPFVPKNAFDREKRCEEILNIQAYGLKKRLEHTNCKNAVLGISGGLDSTLALLVTVRAFDLLGLERKGITAITMPGFGTTDRTYDNAVTMIKCVGATFMDVPISDAVREHFKAIGHDEAVHDVTYENSQARERTQILMDVANEVNGLVIGTGDMSELALGWATYNGDHMSMYGVNCSVPKTLVRHLVRFYADTCEDKTLNAALLDVLDTPVSPELLPPEKGVISQKTEDLVGPYELHDFFLYYVMRTGFAPSKIYMLAKKAFNGAYDDETILKWLKTFYRRFFSQQFKRSCVPDGPKVGSVALSPRGDLRMPSDASVKIWMDDLESL